MNDAEEVERPGRGSLKELGGEAELQNVARGDLGFGF